MSILLKNGTIVTATEAYQADLLTRGDRIADIGVSLSKSNADQVVDASGLYVMPGGIDVQCHIQLNFGGVESADDYELGLMAAAFGGTTCIVDIAFQDQGKSLREALETWHQKAANKAVVDYSFHMGITDPTEPVLAEMEDVFSEGITSFKLFLAYPGGGMVEDDAFLRILQNAKQLGAVTIVHAENGRVTAELARQSIASGNVEPRHYPSSRPAETEAEAVERAIFWAEMVGTPVYFFHVSSMLAVQRIQAARDRGAAVFAETCPHYLLLSVDRYDEPGIQGAKYVCSPPLRTETDQQALWSALMTGDVQVVSSDHCAYQFHGHKDRAPKDFRDIPGGLPGVETRLPLVFDRGVSQGRIGLNRFVQVVATNPAKIFGMYPRKGTLAIGSDADVVVWDPNVERTLSADDLHMSVDYTPFEGFRVSGAPRMVFCRGQAVVEDGKFVGKRGAGQFIGRSPYDPFHSI